MVSAHVHLTDPLRNGDATARMEPAHTTDFGQVMKDVVYLTFSEGDTRVVFSGPAHEIVEFLRVARRAIERALDAAVAVA